MRIDMKKNIKSAFTLAETLIGLGLIAIIATMTIPPLLNTTQDAEYKTAYAKAYSVLGQALLRANTENALVSATGTYDTKHLDNYKAIMSYFNPQKICYSGDNSECWNRNGEEYNSTSYSNGYPALDDLAILDASGMSWAQYAKYVQMIFVDTNGLKKPNQFGKDRFVFVLNNINGDCASGIPIKITTTVDNDIFACKYNLCGVVGGKYYNTYFSRSWLFGK